MSDEVGKVAEQNSALLAFLDGTWTARFTVHLHADRATASGDSEHARYPGVKLCGVFQPLPDGSVAGRYMLIQNTAGDDKSTTDCVLRLALDRSDNALVAYLGNAESVPGIKGVWSNSGLRFSGDFHDGMTIWTVFEAIRPKVVTRPSTVSIIVRQASEWNGMGNKRIALLLFGGWIPVYQATREHVLNPLGVNSSAEYVQALPDRLSEFQNFRNGFVHHDLAETDDLLRTWECFQDCLKGLLHAFYSGS